MKFALVGGSRFAIGGLPALIWRNRVTVPCELVAVIPWVQGGPWQRFCCGYGTSPLIVAVPLPLSLKFNHSRFSFGESVDVGTPVATTVKFAGTPAVTFSVPREMMLS